MDNLSEMVGETDETLKERQTNIEQSSSFVDSVFQALLELILRVGQLLFYGLVEINAAFLTAVMTHPDVKQSMANIMVMGMNGFVTQPDLDEKFQIMTDTMAKNQEEAARNAGQEFPKLAGKFLEGMFSKKQQIDAAVEKEKTKRDKEKQILTASSSSSDESKTQKKLDNSKDREQKKDSSPSSTDSASTASAEGGPAEEKPIPPLARFFKPNPTPPTTPHRSSYPPAMEEHSDENAKSPENQDPPIVRFFKQQSNKNKTHTESKETQNTTPARPSSKTSPKPARTPLIQWPSPFQKAPEREEPPLVDSSQSAEDHESEAIEVQNDDSLPEIPERESIRRESKSWDASCFQDALANEEEDDDSHDELEKKTTSQSAATANTTSEESENDSQRLSSATETEQDNGSLTKPDKSPKTRNSLIPPWPSAFQNPNTSSSVQNVPPLPSTESADDGDEEGGICMPTLDVRTSQSLDVDEKH